MYFMLIKRNERLQEYKKTSKNPENLRNDCSCLFDGYLHINTSCFPISFHFGEEPSPTSLLWDLGMHFRNDSQTLCLFSGLSEVQVRQIVIQIISALHFAAVTFRILFNFFGINVACVFGILILSFSANILEILTKFAWNRGLAKLRCRES